MADRDEIIAFCDQLLEPGIVRRLRAQRPAGPGLRAGGRGGDRRDRPARAVRACGGGRGAAGDLPSRAALGLHAAHRGRGDEPPAEGALRRGHVPRGLPPAPGRPPRDRQQRADLRGARARARRAASAHTPAAPWASSAAREAGVPWPDLLERCRDGVRRRAVRVGRRARGGALAGRGLGRGRLELRRGDRAMASTASSPASRPST